MKKVIFQISKDLARRLDQVRQHFGLSRSEMIETILLRDCLARQNAATADAVVRQGEPWIMWECKTAKGEKDLWVETQPGSIAWTPNGNGTRRWW